MKKYTLLLIALLSGIHAYAGDMSQSTPAPVQVTVMSESKDLAKGYAEASTHLSRPPITLVMQKEGQMRVLEDVKTVRAVEGVLLIEVGKGLTYIINPKDVVYITDGSKIAGGPAAR